MFNDLINSVFGEYGDFGVVNKAYMTEDGDYSTEDKQLIPQLETAIQKDNLNMFLMDCLDNGIRPIHTRDKKEKMIYRKYHGRIEDINPILQKWFDTNYDRICMLYRSDLVKIGWLDKKDINAEDLSKVVHEE